MKKKRLVAAVAVLVLGAIILVLGLFRSEKETHEPKQASQKPVAENIPAKADTPSQEPRDAVTEESPETSPAEDVIESEPKEYELVRIPGGKFLMGSPENEEGRYPWEGPQHEVRVADFYIGKYPVTNAQYAQFTKANPTVRKPTYWTNSRFNQPRQPVVGVSWEEARQYCQWAGLRMPTEAEWEYAARGGTKTRFYSGDADADLEGIGWYMGNSGGATHPVGKKAPNAFGLYDMLGNVFEWVEDDWHVEFEGAPDDGRAWIGSPRGDTRTYRGGSWFYIPRNCRSAVRYHAGYSTRNDDLGFRAAKSIP